MMILGDKIGLVQVLENPDESPKDLKILDLRGGICTNGERGLYSIVSHPLFAQNRWIYAFFTKYRQDCLEDAVLGPWNVVMRLTMDPVTLELNVDEAVEVWRGAVLPKRLHNRGAIAFGNDGKLYITTGDGGERTSAASLDNVHGRLLRINDDGSIPDDNPYTPQSGFTNSYRCSDSEGRVPQGSPSDCV
jgi:glucose/arabinose dehydrogenase